MNDARSGTGAPTVLRVILSRSKPRACSRHPDTRAVLRGGFPNATGGDAPTDAEVSLWTGVGIKP
ncbi:hypothetical protein [Streptomyces massasporeus]|uniref:hypothetical protein n=1 Tax=Streptomyces massasporeus TaxID=67324 RepID=UPI00332C2C47